MSKYSNKNAKIKNRKNNKSSKKIRKTQNKRKSIRNNKIRYGGDNYRQPAPRRLPLIPVPVPGPAPTPMPQPINHNGLTYTTSHVYANNSFDGIITIPDQPTIEIFCRWSNNLMPIHIYEVKRNGIVVEAPLKPDGENVVLEIPEPSDPTDPFAQYNTISITFIPRM